MRNRERRERGGREKREKKRRNERATQIGRRSVGTERDRDIVTPRQRMRKEELGAQGVWLWRPPRRAAEGVGLLAAAEAVSAAPLISLLPDVQIRCQCQRSP